MVEELMRNFALNFQLSIYIINTKKFYDFSTTKLLVNVRVFDRFLKTTHKEPCIKFSKLFGKNFCDSEWSDECIDFTMYSITSRNDAPISNFGGGQKLTFSNSFKKNREKQKKNDGKTGIFTQNQFSTKLIFFYGCNLKTNH
ncbi:Uncharacterized protein FWK35_00004888 [Aphis craccivora]|uniref:Uncharacterized protein n=1 Tax=Aphis craccivora TaxID=307492 RepID=A0A6G0YT46_APHCR|nr:Uncharacterized protein FWK35_00004888 [Aphis craccivora]